MSKSIYPEPSKGDLASDHSNYAKQVHFNGPKDHDLWPIIVFGGIAAFIAAGLWILSLVA